MRGLRRNRLRGVRVRRPLRVFGRGVTDEGYRGLMSGHPLWDEKLRDQKPPPRIEADWSDWVELRREKLGPCRVCTQRGDELHHIVPRGRAKRGGGDDIADNLVGLCRACHRLVENRDPWARSLLGQRLTVAERAYVVGKRSAYWLERNYGVKEEAA